MQSKENGKHLQHGQNIVGSMETYNLFNHLLEIDETDEGNLYISTTNNYEEIEANSNIKREKRKTTGKKCKTNNNNKRNRKTKRNSLLEKIKTTRIVKENTVLKRCHGCHIEHFPLPKFCRWWEKRKTASKEQWNEKNSVNNDLVQKSIQVLEYKFSEIPKNQKDEVIVNNFFERGVNSCNPKENQDIYNLKLRGGGNDQHKVSIKSGFNVLDSVLTFFRDMVPLWHEIDSHSLCNHKLQPNCFYCLFRSLSLRSMNPQVRTPISAVEVLSYLEEKNIVKLKIHDIIISIMDFLTSSEEKVSTMFKSISLYCEKCGKDVQMQFWIFKFLMTGMVCKKL